MAEQMPPAGNDSNVTAGEKSPINLAAHMEPQNLKPSIALFRMLIENHYGDRLRLNVMTDRPEYYDHVEKDWKPWQDVDDARMRAWFQSNYGLYHEKMLMDALEIHFQSHRVNPLTDLLDSLVWDGKPRITTFLQDTMGCEDTPYYREVSRLIFAGGIHRAYQPGCKFDDMVVLVGKQGGGKSTLVRWLNMDDRYFREIKTITGKEGIEALQGVWIAEVAELMAMTRVKEAEAVKAYVTSQEDSYRLPYARHVRTVPRRTVFIGTTNNSAFLSDKTGNRRFYPVLCKVDGYDLLSREAEIRANIAQCWAEALALFRQDALPPFADRSVISLIRQQQEAAMEDDWRAGAIAQYLDLMKREAGDRVTVIELWFMALNMPEGVKPARKDSIEIVQILESMEGWRRSNRVTSTPWGRQKYYERIEARYPF